MNISGGWVQVSLWVSGLDYLVNSKNVCVLVDHATRARKGFMSGVGGVDRNLPRLPPVTTFSGEQHPLLCCEPRLVIVTSPPRV